MELYCSYSYPFVHRASVAGFNSGNLISGELWHLGQGEAKNFFTKRRRNLSWTSCSNGPNKCFQMAGPDKSSSNSIPVSLRGSSLLPPMAIGSNVNEDMDDMFDDLFRKHGKVAFKRKDQKSPTAEVDDDAESLAFAVSVAKIASDVKAGDIRVFFVKPLVYWTSFFIITTAFSRPQIDAIGTRIKDLAEKQYGKVSTGDTKPNSWTLLDFGDAVVHIFLPEQRAFYNLEEFYANATQIELPFENQNLFAVEKTFKMCPI